MNTRLSLPFHNYIHASVLFCPYQDNRNGIIRRADLRYSRIDYSGNFDLKAISYEECPVKQGHDVQIIMGMVHLGYPLTQVSFLGEVSESSLIYFRLGT